MSNNYFQFKQFTIHQDKCAMKVCTDACLFGALIPSGLTNVLDIGTGTGLLPLILAQKNPHTIIDTVEIDADAAQQATENIAASSWANRLHVFNTDVLEFIPDKKYDCIISNPPFFKDDLRSPDSAKNNAKHNTTLGLNQLLILAEKHLTSEGLFAVLLPYKQVEYFIAEANKTGLHLNREKLVKQTFKHKFFRGILFFTRKDSPIQSSEIIIKDSEGNYTAEFTAALKDYYLFL